MLWALYQQDIDPLNNRLLSTLFAALPVLVLFYLLVPRRWLAPRAALGGAVVALLVAWGVYGMPLPMAAMAFLHGALFGLMPVGWTIFNAMLLYNVTVETGQFTVVRQSVAGLSADARIQAILIAFAFGAFIEGAAGGGTPVAICGAIMVGLGFAPFQAAVLCLIANTSPVAYGGLGTPLITLSGVTGIPSETLSIMAGRQLPFVSLFVPLYMIRCMCTWRETWEVWPALLVAGGSFALFQYTFATIHHYIPFLVLYPMTDVGGGIFSLVVSAIFLQFWNPRLTRHYTKSLSDSSAPAAKNTLVEIVGPGHANERRSETLGTGSGRSEQYVGDCATPPLPTPISPSANKLPDDPPSEAPLNWRRVSLAWAPFAVMSILLMLTGLLRQKEQRHQSEHLAPVRMGPLQTRFVVPIPLLDGQSKRDARLQEPGKEQQPESASFEFAWLSAPGSAVFLSALLSMGLLRMRAKQVRRCFRTTVRQMRIPVPTIACMLGLSYVTRYAGMDATLGAAFALTGFLYPFFAALLGWLGVFLTGTDAGSNALFGSLQKITATEIFKAGGFTQLTLFQAQTLIGTANSTGGVMGKMIDAQSICVATAATNQLGREADIFKAVVWHSILLAAVMGIITLLQAYLWPFTRMVPGV
jgi:lactate permease